MNLKRIAIIAAGALLIGCGKGYTQSLMPAPPNEQHCSRYEDGHWWTRDTPGGCDSGAPITTPWDGPCDTADTGKVVSAYGYEYVCDGQRWRMPGAISSAPTPESTPSPDDQHTCIIYGSVSVGPGMRLSCTEVE